MNRPKWPEGREENTALVGILKLIAGISLIVAVIFGLVRLFI